MGCCLSLVGGGSGTNGDGDNTTNQHETEMQLREEKDNEVLCISSGMSSPTIEIKERLQISGTGLALAGVCIEQDCAYWEVQILITNDDDDPKDKNSSTNNNGVFLGLSTKKDSKFYQALDHDETENDKFIQLLQKDDELKKKYGLQFMSYLPNIQHEDIIGILIQQSDLPMIQYYVNGVPRYELSINRFRGTVYPSFYIPPKTSQQQQQTVVKMKIIFREKDFKSPKLPNHCSPVIVARGLV